MLLYIRRLLQEVQELRSLPAEIRALRAEFESHVREGTTQAHQTPFWRDYYAKTVPANQERCPECGGIWDKGQPELHFKDHIAACPRWRS